MSSPHRIFAFHQPPVEGGVAGAFDSVGREVPLTHLVVSDLQTLETGAVLARGHSHTSEQLAEFWDALEPMRARGIKMVAQMEIEGHHHDAYETWYPQLRAFLRQRKFVGLITWLPTELMVRLIDDVRRDFGRDFLILAWNSPEVPAVEQQRPGGVDFYLKYVQHVDADAAVIDGTELPAARVVLGLLDTPIEDAAAGIEELAAAHPDFGGVAVREALSGEQAASIQVEEAITRGLERAEQPEEQLHLIPAPKQVTRREGTMTVPRRINVAGDVELADVVRELLPVGTGLMVGVSNDARIVLRKAEGKPGSYRLEVNDRIRITAPDVEGAANAVATLRQLMPDWAFGPSALPGESIELPCVEIEDEPRLGWRGLHLDVARHFMPLPLLYRFVDLMHLHKLNVLHLHLNDDQGWRFEVKKWPRLTTIGAWREGTQFPHWDEHDGVPHGGFYTQDQLRALVGYAKRRGITVMPELDVPGHVRAALAAYPQFGDGTGENGVATRYGIFEEVLHLDDNTMDFLRDIFTELLEVFDSEVIHIGGDECPKVQWHNSDAAKQLAEQRGLESVDHLQSWLTGQLHDFLAANGRRMIGWDEIIDDAAIPQDAIVMSWRGTEPGQRAISAGHQVVMSSVKPLYFDYYQSKSPTEPHMIGDYNPWQAVAEFDPLEGIPEELHHGIIGMQGQIWTEYMVTPQRVEYMAWPRAAVLAEVAWNGPADVTELEPRLRRHLQRLDWAGVNYRPLDGPHPWQMGGSGRYQRKQGHGYFAELERE